MLVSGSASLFATMPPFSFNTLPGSCRQKFVKAEDDLLIQLVHQFGEKSWATVAQYMKRRTARQCRERYKNYLSPSVSNRPWSEAEDELLTQKVRECGQKWSVIAASFDGRSDVNVKNRWSALVQRNARLQKYLSRNKTEQQELFDGFLNGNQPEEEWDWSVNFLGPSSNSL
jgi:hypothetical protein